MKRFFYLLCFLFIPIFAFSDNITHIKIQDAISPATAKYLNNAFKETKKNNSKLLLIQLDTPGGLASSMREMIQDILNSKIPVVMYVSPKGSRAASAGTYLMYASHIAVMSPGSNIGAATPVNLIENPKSQKEEQTEDKKKENFSQMTTTMQKKVINDSIAYIKSIAELRNRNIPWAIKAVKDGESISSQEALKLNVIDFIANDMDELLKEIDKKELVIDGKKIIINTKNANIIFFAPSWKTKILMTITNPNIAYIFLMLALYGILFEMFNPGAILPGFIGFISASLALYSLNILPFNYVGLLLIFFGVVFMLMEVFISGFGILGIAGVFSLATGSFLLFDEKTLGLGVSYPLIIAFSLVSLALFVYILKTLLKTREKKSISGIENIIGSQALVVKVKGNTYKVLSNGELWNATSKEKLNIDDKVTIENIEGLTLQIRSEK
ncbi:MAG: NfeD family protein [Halarcobacter sp.]